jgi:hypothetical protein
MVYLRQDIQQEIKEVNVDQGRQQRTRETLNLACMEEFLECVRCALLNARCAEHKMSRKGTPCQLCKQRQYCYHGFETFKSVVVLALGQRDIEKGNSLPTM